MPDLKVFESCEFIPGVDVAGERANVLEYYRRHQSFALASAMLAQQAILVTETDIDRSDLRGAGVEQRLHVVVATNKDDQRFFANQLAERYIAGMKEALERALNECLIDAGCERLVRVLSDRIKYLELRPAWRSMRDPSMRRWASKDLLYLFGDGVEVFGNPTRRRMIGPCPSLDDPDMEIVPVVYEEVSAIAWRPANPGAAKTVDK